MYNYWRINRLAVHFEGLLCKHKLRVIEIYKERNKVSAFSPMHEGFLIIEALYHH